MTLTDPEKRDTLDELLLKDFMKKERSLWDDQWMISEEREDERPPEQGMAS